MFVFLPCEHQLQRNPCCNSPNGPLLFSPTPAAVLFLLIGESQVLRMRMEFVDIVVFRVYIHVNTRADDATASLPRGTLQVLHAV